MSNDARWYVIHTYSGYENKVKDSLEKTITNRSMQDVILDLQIPTEEVVEIKNKEEKISVRKKYASYIMIKMYMTDESWYIIRNTRGVTGFVGPDGKPVPLTEAEVYEMGIGTDSNIELGFKVGDNVTINHGALEGFMGIVDEIMFEKHLVRVIVSAFGRETPVELEFGQVSPV